MNRKGLTLTEVLVATLITCLAIGAALACFSQVFYLAEIAKDNTVVVSDIRDMIEEIWSTPFDAIVDNFPDGLTDGPAGNDYGTIVGGFTLGNEHIVVDYVDPIADPLEIMVTTSWTDMRSRNRTIQLSTFRTR